MHLVFDEKRLERPRAQTIEAVKRKLRKNRVPLQWLLPLKGLKISGLNLLSPGSKGQVSLATYGPFLHSNLSKLTPSLLQNKQLTAPSATLKLPPEDTPAKENKYNETDEIIIFFYNNIILYNIYFCCQLKNARNKVLYLTYCNLSDINIARGFKLTGEFTRKNNKDLLVTKADNGNIIDIQKKKNRIIQKR